jgi:hypothetical protein
MSKDWGVKISKENENVSFCADKDLIVSSKFDTLKVGFSDRLTLNYPAWNWNYTGSPVRRTDTVYFEHNLGYIPYYTPRCVAEYLDIFEPGSDHDDYINDIVQRGPYTNYSPPIWVRAYVDIYATTTRLYIKLEREINYMTENGSGTASAGTVYADYTIYRNSLSSEFNLLD